MRVLVTGLGGFAGRWVAGALRARGHVVYGLGRTPPAGPASDLVAEFRRVDVTDRVALEAAVGETAPDAVIHLAALTDPALAEREIATAYRTNLGGTLVVLGAIRGTVPQARLLLASTSLVYGAVEPAELPVRETTPLRPTGIYGATKAAAEIAALQWSRAYGVDVVVARPFNHIGPGQRPDFVCAAIASQLADIEAGRREPVLRLGNLDPVRDFLDVRDVAEGYVALLERGVRGAVYNLCAGEGVSIAEVVALFRTLARVPVRVRSEPGRRRAIDVERIVGSHERATADTGWRPRMPLLESLRDVLEDWRRRPPTAGDGT